MNVDVQLGSIPQISIELSGNSISSPVPPTTDVSVSPATTRQVDGNIPLREVIVQQQQGIQGIQGLQGVPGTGFYPLESNPSGYLRSDNVNPILLMLMGV